MNEVWIVIGGKHIYGKFNSKDRATLYMWELWEREVDKKARIKKLTIDEYKRLCYNSIRKRGKSL